MDTQTKGQSYLPTVVMFHGEQFSSNTWLMLDMVEEITKNGYRILMVDLPSYGGSDHTEPIDDIDERGKFCV